MNKIFSGLSRKSGPSSFARLAISVAAVALTACGTVLGTAGGAQADGNGPGWYGVWGTGVNLRTGGEWCYLYPSVSNCPTITGTVSAPQAVYVYCQEEGAQVVGGNPYWVWVLNTSGQRGYMASYYIENTTNWIDGVPDC